MSSNNKLYLNYNSKCCASLIIKTNIISLCKKSNSNKNKNGDLDK